MQSSVAYPKIGDFHSRTFPFIRKLSAALVVAAISVITIQSAQSETVTGSAVIVDGDTIWVGSEEVRVYGIDAPETAQRCQLPKGVWDCSKAAIGALAAMTDGKTVNCVGNERDRYGRLIARCSTDDVPDVGAKLVASGLAWAFVRYSPDYSALEKKPRAMRIGIWQSRTQPPWEYRARRWSTAAQISSEGCPIKGNINAKGEKIYHAPWSRHYAKTVIEPSKGERWFCSEAEARAAGWRAPYR
ncbi:thermonuclease family protein [Nordella sp. HKS 07]|nr:thermonuclease family protein [Nordella sp. HKS 07]